MARTLLHEALGHYVQARDRSPRADDDAEGGAVAAVRRRLGRVRRGDDAGRGLAAGRCARCAWRRRERRCCARRAWWRRCGCTRSAPSSTTPPRCSPTRPGSRTCRRAARRSARRSIRWCSADALGRIAIIKLRDDWRAAHAGAPLGAFHDALLRHGIAVADLPAQGAVARRHRQPALGARVLSSHSRSASNQTSFDWKPGKLALRPLGLGTTKSDAPPKRCGLAPGPGVASRAKICW